MSTESKSSHLRPGLLVAAIGATLAMLSITVCETIETFNGYNEIWALYVVFLLAMVAMPIGMLLMVKAMPNADSKRGARLMAISSFVALGVFIFGNLLIFVSDKYFIHPGEIINYPDEDWETLRGHFWFALPSAAYVLFIAYQLLLGHGAWKMRKAVAGMNLCAIAYYILAGLTFLASVVTGTFNLVTVWRILFLLIIAGVVLALIGWWIAVAKAGKVSQSVSVELSVEPEMPQRIEPQVAAPVASQAAPTTNSLYDKLMQLDDTQLQDIVDHPELYAKADYVEKAKTLLLKRKAWAVIVDKSDAELMEMVTNDLGIYTDVMRDAASMELYSRQSPLLAEALAGETVESLQQIVASPDDYYDGYVSMARDILAHKQ
jgi:hypothetical protein